MAPSENAPQKLGHILPLKTCTDAYNTSLQADTQIGWILERFYNTFVVFVSLELGRLLYRFLGFRNICHFY